MKTKNNESTELSSENKKKSRPKRRRRRPRNKNNSENHENKEGTATPSANSTRNASSAQSDNANQNSRNRNRNRNRNKNRRNKSQGPQKRNINVKTLDNTGVIKAYSDLFEAYIKARKLHFEAHGRNDAQKARTRKDRYLSSMEAMTKFEQQLSPAQFIVLEEHFNIGPKDSQYSEKHKAELESENENYEVTTEQDSELTIHLLDFQKDKNEFKNDTEVSRGTKEDFEAYKEQRKIEIL